MLPARGWRIMYPQTTTRAMSEASSLHEAGDDPVRGEVLACDLARGATLARVVSFDRVDGRNDVVDAAEGEQALARRDELPEGGVLRDHGTAGCEVTGASVAEPTR